jgi:hypothetical protein
MSQQERDNKAKIEARAALHMAHLGAQACKRLTVTNESTAASMFAVRSVRWYREACESLSDLQARDPYTVSRILAEFA